MNKYYNTNEARVDFCNSNEDDYEIVREVLKDYEYIPTKKITQSSLKKFREKYNIPKGKILHFYVPEIDRPEINDCIKFKRLYKPFHPSGAVLVLDKQLCNWK